MDFDSILRGYEEQLNAAKRAAADTKAAADARAQSTYDGTVATLQKDYDTNSGVVNKRYDTSIDQQNKTSDDALNDAYVGKMLAARNIGQQMAAMGLGGGAAESTLLAMDNNYRTGRTGLEQERGRAIEGFNLARSGELADLMSVLNRGKTNANDVYQGRLMDAEAAYNASMQQAQAQYEANRAQMLAMQLQHEQEMEALRQRAATRSARSSGGPGPVHTNNPVWGNADKLNNQLKQQGYTDEQAARYINNIMRQQGVNDATRKHTLAQLGY